MIAPGTKIGNYKVLKRLHRGVNFDLYEGETVRGARVAIKVPVPKLAKEYEFLRKMQQNFQRVRHLDHPNVARVLFCTPLDAPQPAIVSEFVPGVDFRKFLEEHGKLFPEVALLLALKILGILRYLHAQELVFGGLKPENLILDSEQGEVRLTDVGISIVPDDLIDHVSRYRGLSYLAPEQVRLEARDRRTDLYALGILLYHATTGHEPFLEKERLKILRMISANERIPPPRGDAIKMTEGVNRIILKLCMPAKEERYEGFDEVERDIRDALALVDLKQLNEEVRAFVRDPRNFTAAFVQKLADANFARGKQLYLARQRQEARPFLDRARELDGSGNRRVDAFIEAADRRRKIFTVAVSATIVVLAGALFLLYFLFKRLERTEVAPPPARIETKGEAGEPQEDILLPAIPENGELNLSVDREAELFLDGRPFGKIVSGNVFSLLAGTHRLRLECPGCVTHEAQIEIKPRERLDLSVTMRLKPVSLRVEGDPSGYSILIDGTPIASDLLDEPIELPAGRHLIEVKKGKRTIRRLEHDFEPGTTQTLKIR
ncbi:MAG: hypothetical protein D6795_16900 [Deltaproteobacteria bacterium]|nr:MAG: hypothetical protein D6795_16900 [Deltaproteobacteria bacterium]